MSIEVVRSCTKLQTEIKSIILKLSDEEVEVVLPVLLEAYTCFRAEEYSEAAYNYQQALDVLRQQLRNKGTLSANPSPQRIMKWNRLIQLLLLLVAVKCNEACTKLLERQSTNAVSSTAVRDVTTIAERIVRQAAIQVVGEIAKPSAVETTKGVVRSVAKKSLEVARLAVVFGVVDGPGDAVRASAPGDKVSSEYLIILENQRALQVMQERQEQRKLKLQRIMKNLELRELEMCIPIKSRMVTEGLSAEKDGKPDTQSCTRKDMALDAAQLDSDEPEKEGLPRWAAFIAYFVGSFTAFLGFLIVYHCCKFSCKGTDDGNVYVHKWTPHTPRV